MKNVLSLSLILLLFGCGETQDIPVGDPDDPVVAVSVNDPEMAAAEAEAQRTLDDFISALETPAPGQSQFGVKYCFTEGSEAEHMWISDLTYSDGQFSGRLGNIPAVLTQIKEGDPVSVPRAAVEDWLYFDGEDLVGGFTVKVLMGRE
ncbi:MAG: DUF2314 domain-containing protein [Planctomycetaceae bacterium]|nr:DUF2314 domain-containing protein [Planctomycetaceae bacterium]